MPTDEERREVARRLRELRSGWTSGECYYTIIHALGLPDTSREDGGHALYSLLADLIEPEPERTCHPVDYRIDIDEGFITSTCSECGELLVNFDFEQDPPKPIGYCPGCGARVIKEES